MNSYRQIRLPADIHASLMSDPEKSISDAIRETMQEYADGHKTLQVPDPKDIKRTSVWVDSALISAVSAIANANGVSFDKAVSLMMEEYLRSKPHQPK